MEIRIEFVNGWICPQLGCEFSAWALEHLKTEHGGRWQASDEMDIIKLASWHGWTVVSAPRKPSSQFPKDGDISYWTPPTTDDDNN